MRPVRTRPMADELVGPSTESELPEGTVTILFTDLVDSTKLYQQHGDDGANLILREVEQSAHELIDRHRGIVVKGTGDGLMVAFQSARRGVAYARSSNSRWPTATVASRPSKC